MINEEIASVKKSISDLLDYCQKNNWLGYDPYDGLNSQVFNLLPSFAKNRFTRLLLIQGMKRSPLNFRPILGIPRSLSPKGLALFSSALTKLNNFGFQINVTPLDLIENLIQLRSPGTPYMSWGYNFDWQQRFMLVPKFTPNIICTTFAGNAIIDAYEKSNCSKYLDFAVSSGDFIINSLNKSEDKDGVCFSYTPIDNAKVHNANLLGAEYLLRLSKFVDKSKYSEIAFKAVEYSIKKQNDDGSWFYGEYDKQKWVDNFHTGYNLVALKRISDYSGEVGLYKSINKGFDYYINNLFTKKYIPKYFSNNLYPIDIHSISQSIITLVELKNLNNKNIEIASSIFRWSELNMKNTDGYYYYQKNKFYTNKIPYMRWSQAWMLCALSFLLECFQDSYVQEKVSLS